MRYRELHVWQLSVALVADVYQISSHFPADERFGLTSQMRRSAVSIPANIAEGHGRATPGEFVNHLSVARGSANELETLIHVALILGLLAEAQVEPIQAQINRVQAMLVGLRTKIRRAAGDR